MNQNEVVSVQYVSFEVDVSNTARMWAVYQAIGNPPAPNTVTDQQRQTHYFRFLADHLVNIINRQVAQNRIAPQTNGRLTVVAAPEFYFTDRLVGGSVASDVGQPFNDGVVTAGLQYLGQQLANIQGNILLFAGSVWSWEAYQESRPEYQGMAGQNAPNVAIHNYAPVFYNGALVHNWHKRNLSQLDGLGNPAANWGPATHWATLVQQRGWDQNLTLTMGAANPYFTINVGNIAVNVGIEVCLDHIAGIRYLRNHNNGHLDMHMLVCAGMPADGASIACRAGGLFMRCEGGNGWGGQRSNCGTRTQQNVQNNAVPQDAASNTYESVAARAAHQDERVRIYNAVNITGPS